MVAAEQPPERVCLGRPAAAARVGYYFRSWNAVWRVLPPPYFRAYTPPLPGLPTQWSAGPQLQGQVQLGDPTADGSQTKARPLPGPIKPSAFPAFIVSGVAN